MTPDEITINLEFLPRHGLPQHRLPVQVNGRRVHAWLLTSVDNTNCPTRNTVAFNYPPALINVLPRELRASWYRFMDALVRQKTLWRYKSMPTLKRVVREHRAHETNLLSSFPLTTVFYRLGAIPALRVGSVRGPEGQDWQVAVLPAPFEQHGGRAFSDPEKLEVLKSLEEFLPHMLEQYYANIANYLNTIFFAAPDSSVLAYCLRIRQIIGQSIRTKLDDIRCCQTHLPQSFKLASELCEQYADEIREADAVDDFAHLLVNYIYRFFCIKDRVDGPSGYYSRLIGRQQEPDLVDDNSRIQLMQQCAVNMARPDATSDFLEELHRNRSSRPEWLQTMAEASALVAEVLRFTSGTPMDRPRVFVSHHFGIPDSEQFYQMASQRTAQAGINVELITGRKLLRHIRWSVLARIWFSDHQVLFLPSSWVKGSGEPKKLKPREDWVTLELLFGDFLSRPQTAIIRAPVNEDVVEAFRAHVAAYIDEKEIHQIDPRAWRDHVGAAKADLAQRLHSTKYIPCDMGDFGEFWGEFSTRVIESAARDLLKALCRAWCYFFDSEDWSIVQALLMLRESERRDRYSTRELRCFIEDKAHSVQCFSWARSMHDSKLQVAVTRRAKDVGQFAYIVEGREVRPVVLEENNKPYHVRLEAFGVIDILSKRFGVMPTAADVADIVRQWVARPPDGP